MIHRLTRLSLVAPFLGVFLALSGCLYDQPPSGPARDIDSWLLGQWTTQDKSGHEFKAIVTPASSDHYKVEFLRSGKEALEFDGWISRVDGFSLLVLKSLNQDDNFGKFALYHYELLSAAAPPPGGIGASRIRISELQLDESARTLDSFKLRAAIRSALKDGTLLLPHEVVADLKNNKTQIPGSIIWTKVGGVTLKGETF